MKKIDKTDISIIVFVALYNLAILFFSLLWIFTNTFSAIKGHLGQLANFSVNENITYGLFLSGTLGGAFYCLRALYERLGYEFTPIAEGQNVNSTGLNMKVWFFWYLYRPIQGGVIALIMLTLINCNLFSIPNMDANSMKSYYILVAIGFLCGFGSHEVMHKIQEIIKVVFAKATNTGSSSEQKVKENNNSN